MSFDKVLSKAYKAKVCKSSFKRGPSGCYCQLLKDYPGDSGHSVVDSGRELCILLSYRARSSRNYRNPYRQTHFGACIKFH